MIAPMRGRALVTAGWIAACNPVTPPGLVLDVGRVCEDIELAVADPDVLPGWTIHAAAIPRGGADAAWYLASEKPGELELRRVPEDMPGLDLSALGSAREFVFQRGPVEGQLWLALDREASARLWRIDETSATLLEGPAIVDFPGDASVTTGWIRRVVFLGQTPHLIALPRQTQVGEVEVHVATITSTLELGERWSMTAKITCPPLSELNCPLFWDDVRELSVHDVAEPGSVAGAALLVTIRSPDEPDPDPSMPTVFETHLLSLTLQRDPTAERPVVTRRDHYSWTTEGPVQPWPAQIAADPLGLYLLVGLIPGPDSSSANATPADYLFRAELLGSSVTDEGGVIALMPKELDSHLLQLGSRVAIGQRPNEHWYVAPIEGITIDEEIVGSLMVGDRVELVRAGRGQMVVVAEEGPSRRVQVACSDPDAASETPDL